MSNEIAHGSDSANTLYAHVYRFADKFIYITASGAFEAVGTWNDARAQATDIPMTAAGDTHFADFPVVAKGVYFVLIKIQAGGAPDTDDLEDGQGVIYWDGAKEINDLSEVNSWFKNG